MKKITISLIMVGFISLSAQAEDKPTAYYGPTSLEKKKLQALEVFGPAHLEETTIAGMTKVLGPLSVKDCKLAEISVMGPVNAKKVTMKAGEVNGPVKLERAIVDGKLTINGPFYAEESNFKEMIDIATDKMTLDHSMATQIHVRKNDSWLEKPQRVTLTNKTVVSGDITFEAGNGLVFIKKGATLKGKVQGGKSIEK